jgi:hypothetical protein
MDPTTRADIIAHAEREGCKPSLMISLDFSDAVFDAGSWV